VATGFCKSGASSEPNTNFEKSSEIITEADSGIDIQLKTTSKSNIFL
jgi:hypothetical protein